MVQQYSTINHLNTHVHDSEATLAHHVARFDAIATSCSSATPWQSLNRREQAARCRASKSPDFSGDLPLFDKIMKISRSPDFE